MKKKYSAFYKHKQPHLLIEKDTKVFTTKKRIYAVNTFKKLVLICDPYFKTKLYLNYWELEKVNSLINRGKNEN